MNDGRDLWRETCISGYRITGRMAPSTEHADHIQFRYLPWIAGLIEGFDGDAPAMLRRLAAGHALEGDP